MEIRTEVREVEKLVKSMSSDKMTQIAIISKAQSTAMGTTNQEHNITVFAIVKNRIIRG